MSAAPRQESRLGRLVSPEKIAGASSFPRDLVATFGALRLGEVLREFWIPPTCRARIGVGFLTGEEARILAAATAQRLVWRAQLGQEAVSPFFLAAADTAWDYANNLSSTEGLREANATAARALLDGGTSEVLLAGMASVACTRRDPIQAAIAVIEISAPSETPRVLKDLLLILRQPSRRPKTAAAARHDDRGTRAFVETAPGGDQ